MPGILFILSHRLPTQVACVVFFILLFCLCGGFFQLNLFPFLQTPSSFSVFVSLYTAQT